MSRTSEPLTPSPSTLLGASSAKRSRGALALALLLGATSAQGAGRPRYGGELRVLIPTGPLELDRVDPADLRAPLDLQVARTLCEPLLRLTPEGALQGRLLQAPEVDPKARLLSLKLRPGLRYASGAPLRAREVVEALKRLGEPGSPFQAALLPLGGPGGLSARSEVEVGAAFEFPYPDWPLALTHPAACAAASVHGKPLAGPAGDSGPFALEGKLAAPATRLLANPETAAGRPYADKLALRTATRANATRALAGGQADVSLVPVAEFKAVEGPLTVATYLAFNPRRVDLGPVAKLLSGSLDRAELVRNYLRAPAVPLYGLLAPSVEPHPVPAPVLGAAQPLAAKATGELLVEFGQDEQKAVAERLQVKLHDANVELKVVALPRAELAARVARGEYDVALVSLPALPEAGLNLAQVLLLAAQPELAKSELVGIGAVADAAGRRERASQRARSLAPALTLLPLYAQGLAAAARPAVNGLRFEPTGTLDLGELWLSDLR